MSVHLHGPVAPLEGTISVPGDKSISHRAALLAAVSHGTSEIFGFSPGEDAQSTLVCLRQLGIEYTMKDDVLLVRGCPSLAEPADILDCGNSGTTMRMLLGLLAGREFFAVLTGDESLRRRPMRRVLEPLTKMGARICGRQDGQLAPLSLIGQQLQGCDHQLPVASAQVKSALLWAGLSARGTTRISEPHPSRDHTERLFSHAGIRLEESAGQLQLLGGQIPHSFQLTVPGDLSSAAFFIIAACLVPGSALSIEGVGLNPTRSGFLRVLERMGAQLEIAVTAEGPEPIGTVGVKGIPLTGAIIEPREVPSLIDELPVLAVAAAMANGSTRMEGIEELRYKESDRLQAICQVLEVMGGQFAVSGDTLTIAGGTLRGASIDAGGDHRIAMMAAIAALAADGHTTITGSECVNVSYPSFFSTLDALRGGG